MDHYFGFNTPESRKKQRKAALTEIGEKATTFFWDIAPEQGFEMREGQQDMSFEIVDALIHDQHFAVEAGVGIGKSFGYLVPILLYNKKMRKPVIVATSTIALQEQLWKDVHDIMPVSYTHLKIARMDTFVAIANVLEVSADALLVDVVEHSALGVASELSAAIADLPHEERMRVLKVVSALTDK